MSKAFTKESDGDDLPDDEEERSSIPAGGKNYISPAGFKKLQDEFYDLKHVLILGRCTSGRGGDLLLEGAREVFQAEFPELLKRISLHLPDEKVRRVGQSVAAASLPKL